MNNGKHKIGIPSGGPDARQAGVALLEALIAILVFSLGILTVIGIQAASIKMAAEAQYRTRAALLADRLIGEMWTGGDSIADLETKFKSPDGAAYLAWLADVKDFTNGKGLPGVEDGASSTLPTVQIAALDRPAGTGSGSSLTADVTVTLYWRTPSMASDEKHQHIVISQISRNP
ncbi:MAG: hypothetical protein LBI87_15075 [Candidatus Accumulibacter sp.]|jgi:type IV pilus assembly protein PilV|nr:hypothetical protein [Accumulibacter sp.]